MTKLAINNKNLMNKNTNFILYTMLIISTIIVISSTSWISAWMGLEINMMSFIPLMMNNKNMKTSNSMMMYFIIQSISSSTLMMSMLTMKMMNFLSNIFISTLMTMSLILKLGASPFHWWIPKIINNLSWMNCLILMTWQKIAPISLMIQISTKSMIYISALMSSLWGAILATNQTSLKMILSYSSINHMGWMMLALMVNLKMTIMYYMFYSLINLIICINLNKYNINYMNQMFKINNNKMTKLIMKSSFLSLGGIPPFTGFTPKLLVLMILMKNSMFMEVFLMIIMTLIILTVYMNPMISSLLMNKINNKWMNKINLKSKSNKINLLTFNLMTTLSLSMWFASKMI
uniref:NADH-ubiquinone oxidoreductase chain 2 n=1 Tax=Athalia tanaoserrula TaxID=2813725 RepID=A0A977TLC7_9HYME|nr:NADH dehydrogenase subunit 2 [Athalia tanaoserrula]UXW93568.1 NADH dehydrogenase subunit 2 [Athalia tanaoserrula]